MEPISRLDRALSDNEVILAIVADMPPAHRAWPIPRSDQMPNTTQGQSRNKKTTFHFYQSNQSRKRLSLEKSTYNPFKIRKTKETLAYKC
ncbi:hypothetical protein, partial [Pseudomonas cichorii]|uniref:hypothetical protein n=1 Tax=Pseudomonas cichorii TaxID=36746 RepID=UPI001E4E050B